MSMHSAPPNGWFGDRPKDEEAMERATLEFADDLVRQFSERDQMYRDIDAVLWGELPVEIPEAYRKTAIEVRGGTTMAMHIANTVTAALSVNPMSIQFKPIGFGDVYQQNATLREHFFESSWTRQETEARRQLLRLFLWSLAVKGEGILKTVERCHTAWGEYDKESKDIEDELEKIKEYDQDAKDRMYHTKTEEVKLRLPYPICTTDVPPETFYYTKNENGLTGVVEIKDLPYQEALERFGTGLDSHGNVVDPKTWSGLDPRAAELARAEWSNLYGRGGNGTISTIRCIEAWDYKCQVIVLQGPNQRHKGSGKIGEGTLCKVIPHTYGDPLLKTLRGPYFHALGITTASRLPERCGLGILAPFLSLFPILDSTLTMRLNAAYLTAFPAFKRNVPPGQVPGMPAMPYGTDGREQQQTKIEPGKLYPFDISPIDQPKSGIDFDKLQGDLQHFMDLALPSVVQGMVASDQSGYALNQAAYLARLGWDPIVSNAEVALGERVGFESWLIEKRIGEKVYAWGEVEAKKGKKTIGGQSKAAWLGIGPEDLKGVHRYDAQLSPSTPSNEIIQTRAIGEKMQLKLITYEDAVEQSGSNPDEVEKSWLLHELKNTQEVQTLLKQKVFQKLGTIESERMAAAGMPSPEEMSGAPPPNMAPPGAAGVPGGTPGTPPMGPPGGMPPNPVPSPGAGLPIAPPPPPGVGGGMPPGGIPGAPVVPGPPGGMIGLPGGGP
jgi:hypothetical protein